LDLRILSWRERYYDAADPIVDFFPFEFKFAVKNNENSCCSIKIKFVLKKLLAVAALALIFLIDELILLF
jgi:hypothetical protein